MSTGLHIDESLKEAFIEIANIGIGKAADSLSRLAQKHVQISVPTIKFAQNESEEIEMLKNLEPSVLIEQEFTDDINGTGCLILNSNGALKLAQLLLGGKHASDLFGEIEQGAILELGNIMICGLIGNLANMLDFELYYNVPEIQLSGVNKIDSLQKSEGSLFAILECQLSIDVEEVSGSLIISMSTEDFMKVIERVHSKYFPNL